tara:strand:- start:286 stop:534 length:249 start_codon:yes stop_codon:yes gene_type:complete
MTISPCISICKTDHKTGYCYGCGRNNDDKIKWKDKNTSKEWKIENLKILRSRLSNWQLDRFDKNYDDKIKNGLSLAKKANQK